MTAILWLICFANLHFIEVVILTSKHKEKRIAFAVRCSFSFSAVLLLALCSRLAVNREKEAKPFSFEADLRRNSVAWFEPKCSFFLYTSCNRGYFPSPNPHPLPLKDLAVFLPPSPSPEGEENKPRCFVVSIVLVGIIQYFVLMIYKAFRFDDIHAIGVIGFADHSP